MIGSKIMMMGPKYTSVCSATKKSDRLACSSAIHMMTAESPEKYIKVHKTAFITDLFSLFVDTKDKYIMFRKSKAISKIMIMVVTKGFL